MILIKSPWKLNIYRGKKNMLNDIWPDLQNVRKMAEKKDLGFSPKSMSERKRKRETERTLKSYQSNHICRHCLDSDLQTK